MEKRVLKVESLFVNQKNWKEADGSQIRLKGLWLRNCGFKPGDRVQVIPKQNGELLIRRREA